MLGWSKQHAVIRVPKNSLEIPIDPATKSSFSKFLELSFYIKTIEDSRQYPSLANYIAQVEHVGERVVPINIGKLVEVDDQEKPDEDVRETSINEFSKEKAVLNKIEGLGHIHTTGEHLRSISYKVADCLNDHPRTHCC